MAQQINIDSKDVRLSDSEIKGPIYLSRPVTRVDKGASTIEVLNATSAIGLRRLVGLLGIALPFSCLAATIFFGVETLPTISHYYYSLVRGPFTAILCALGFALYVYRGYDRWDNIATNIASAGAFGVGLFATSRANNDATRRLPELGQALISNEAASEIVHVVSAITLFVMFFFISGFLFTRQPDEKGKPPTWHELASTFLKTWLFTKAPSDVKDPVKERENKVHRRCAWMILISIVAIVAVPRFGIDSVGPFPTVALFESTAIFSFAWSWLTKNRGEANALKLISDGLKRQVAEVVSFINPIPPAGLDGGYSKALVEVGDGAESSGG